jgi:hypothetical protein
LSSGALEREKPYRRPQEVACLSMSARC